jgi:hypothetical protein
MCAATQIGVRRVEQETRNVSTNFVDVVGYQLEKVHTGVIAWLLDSERSPLESAERALALRNLAPNLPAVSEQDAVKAVQEYSFGRQHRIDLVLMLGPDEANPKAAILIECKVDSDVSVNQLAESAKAFSAEHSDVPLSVIALALGAGQFTVRHLLADLKDKGFQAVDLKHALQIFSSLSVGIEEKVYHDWIASLKAEHERNSQVDRALVGMEHPWDDRLSRAGYRTGFPVFYAFYDKLRMHLEKGPFQDWHIGSGSNNPVMTWNDSWVTLGGTDDAIELYWEFNWSALCLKAHIKNDGTANWNQIRSSIVELCETCSLPGRKARGRSGTWVTAYKWEFDFCKETLGAIASKTTGVLSQLHERLRSVA